MSDIFKAIADPTRRSILLKIAEKPMNMNEIAADFQISRPAVSKHVKILEDCELLKVKNDSFDGRQRNCSAQLEALNEVNEYLANLHKFWEARLNNLGKFLDHKNNKND